jgi:lysophospholipase L1-like esterase
MMRTTVVVPNGHRNVGTASQVDPFGNSLTPIFRRCVFLWTVIFLIWISRPEDGSTSWNERQKQSDDHHVFVSHNLCIDDDDDPNAFQQSLHIKKSCPCFDPLTPRKRYDEPAWDAHREVMLQDIAYATNLELEHAQDLDVVLYGDSITEHWNGTRSMGRIPVTKYRTVFETYFHKKYASASSSTTSSSARLLQGLALGTSGDVSVELLWLLQNGLLPDSLQPNVIFLLIGTNDLGRTGCSKQTTLAGILQVAEYIRHQRPQTPLIIHGLLPRNDVYKDENNQDDYSLGMYWRQILWINRELKRFCSSRDHWHYMDSAKIFLEKVPEEKDHPDTRGSYRIKKEYMMDALHPTVVGYEAWGARIVAKVQKVMNQTSKS